MAANELFQSFWLGKSLFPHHWLCLTSFIDNGHRFRLFSYDPIAVPKGVECRDAREILPRDRVFTYPRGAGAGSPAAFANLFRYKLLAEHGGWWVDTDVFCRTRVIPDGELLFAREQPFHVNNAVLKLPRGHPLACQLFAAADAAGTDLNWGETGPDLLTRLVVGSVYEADILPAEFCHPILGAEGMQYLQPEHCASIESKTSRSPLIHLWNEKWRQEGVDFWAPPPTGSFVAKLYGLHGLDPDLVGKAIRHGTTRLRSAASKQPANPDHVIDYLRATLDDLQTSTSWKITGPIRAIRRRVPEAANWCRQFIYGREFCIRIAAVQQLIEECRQRAAVMAGGAGKGRRCQPLERPGPTRMLGIDAAYELNERFRNLHAKLFRKR